MHENSIDFNEFCGFILFQSTKDFLSIQGFGLKRISVRSAGFGDKSCTADNP
ncbi:Uncharacterized protein dnm_027650 [Desulfonema magnum]|uniref:Uncharacterized protein n=1 Tax=Desulfonema magnum TaxID=45655 RepID=A0A975GMB5_9BACT|nr:Uncharacterized protein dnm_027650 [Desulfonema magnum]